MMLKPIKKYRSGVLMRNKYRRQIDSSAENRVTCVITLSEDDDPKADAQSKHKQSMPAANQEAFKKDKFKSVTSIVSAVSDVGLEYDYYDYDVGNACAVPGSIFGMETNLAAWSLDINDLDIKSPDELSTFTLKETTKGMN